MFDKTFAIKYLSNKNCFCYISDKNSYLLEKGSVLKIEYGSEKLFATCLALSGLKLNEIGINVTFARSLGLKENDSVQVSTASDLPGVKTVIISPLTQDDYDIIELSRDNIQNNMMNQIRVVHKGQKIVIWISNVHVTVQIEDVFPNNPGRLNYLTEIFVQQPIMKKAKPKKEKPKNKPSIWSMSFINYFKKETELPKETDLLEKHKDNIIPLIFRVHSIEDLKKCINIDSTPKIFQQPFNIFVKRQYLPSYYKDIDSLEDIQLLNLRIVTMPTQSFGDEDKETEVVVRLCILDDFCDNVDIENICRLPSLFINENLLHLFEVYLGAKVLLEACNEEAAVNDIEVQPMSDKLFYIDDVKKFLNEHCSTQKFVINCNVPIKLLNNTYCKFKFKPDVGKHCLVDQEFLKKCKISIGPANPNFEEHPLTLSNLFMDDYCMACSNYQKIVDNSMDILKLGFNVSNYVMENILITGKAGSGKSTLAKIFSYKANLTPYHVHTEYVNCKSIKGKTIDSLQKFFLSIFSSLIYYQPSLLVLDDLDVLCEKVAEEGEPNQENQNKISECLASIIELNLQTNCIAIVATAQSAMRLNKNIFSSRGRHYFKNTFTIDDLKKNDRKILLNHLFKKKAKKFRVDFEDLSTKTEGYVMQDLVDFVDKIIFEAYKKGDNIVSMDNCDVALTKTSSLSLRDVQLHSPGEKDFDDIGGLLDVKRIITESMLWPVQYSNLFGKSPLRLQSGLLLYGPPGTGKTLLAGAAAKHCGLRLISIKGPELLSKYIGASEQSVRDVFLKAQSARPCILFFDEFDSLAPRRGHDSTGVTDRVVNQFLTQLDGVETLTGVCVMAATSRPDLLDPALLRPGRLDKQILCPLPDKKSRMDILKCLSKNMNLEKKVNLDEIAQQTDNFSGADLQAILYTAQLSSVEILLDADKGAKSEKINPKITQQHLRDALKNTRPSLTKAERMKYERIYARFQGKNVSDDNNGKMKVTFA